MNIIDGVLRILLSLLFLVLLLCRVNPRLAYHPILYFARLGLTRAFYKALMATHEVIINMILLLLLLLLCLMLLLLLFLFIES